jgi:hypothetical protein
MPRVHMRHTQEELAPRGEENRAFLDELVRSCGVPQVPTRVLLAQYRVYTE